MVTDFERGFDLGRQVQIERDNYVAALTRLEEQSAAHDRCKEALREANETISALQEMRSVTQKAAQYLQFVASPQLFRVLVEGFAADTAGSRPIRAKDIKGVEKWWHPDGCRGNAGSKAVLYALDALFPNGAPEGANEP